MLSYHLFIPHLIRIYFVDNYSVTLEDKVLLSLQLTYY